MGEMQWGGKEKLEPMMENPQIGDACIKNISLSSYRYLYSYLRYILTYIIPSIIYKGYELLLTVQGVVPIGISIEVLGAGVDDRNFWHQNK